MKRFLRVFLFGFLVQFGVMIVLGVFFYNKDVMFIPAPPFLRPVFLKSLALVSAVYAVVIFFASFTVLGWLCVLAKRVFQNKLFLVFTAFFLVICAFLYIYFTFGFKGSSLLKFWKYCLINKNILAVLMFVFPLGLGVAFRAGEDEKENNLSHKVYAEEQNFIRGSRLLKDAQARKALLSLSKASGKNVLGGGLGVKIWENIALPYTYENQHILIVGSPGSGKTQVIYPLIRQVIKRGDKVVIWDVKGTYIQALVGEPGVDLLAPWDSRSIQWSPGKDILNSLDCQQLAEVIIPKTAHESQPYFSNSARLILEAVLVQLDASSDQWGWADIWQIISQGKDGLEKELQRSEEGRAAAITIKGDSKSGQDVYSCLISAVQSLQWLAKAWPNEGKSLRQWVTASAGNKVMILGGMPLREGLAAVTAGMAIQIMVNEVLSLPDDYSRRIWFFLDEFATLGTMESLLKVLSLGRSKGLCVVTGIQDIGKIEHLYGVHLAKSFANTFSTAIFLRCSDTATSTCVSDVMGEQEVKEINQSKFLSKPEAALGKHKTKPDSQQEVFRNKQVFLPSQISNFKNLSGVLRVNGWPLAFLTWPLIQIQQKVKLSLDADWVNCKTRLDGVSEERKASEWRLT